MVQAFEYLILATGTRLQEPGTLKHEDKLNGIQFFQEYQNKIKAAQRITILGAGKHTLVGISAI